MRPHRRQPTRLPRPWDSPGKNTGVGCHFLLQRRKVKSESEVAQSCPTLSDPMDCSLPGSSTHGIFQARVLEWGAIAFSDTLYSFPLFSLKIPQRILPSRPMKGSVRWAGGPPSQGCSQGLTSSLSGESLPLCQCRQCPRSLCCSFHHTLSERNFLK